MSVEMELAPLRLIGDDMAVKLDLAALGLKRLAAFDEVLISVPRLIKSFIDVDQAVLLKFFPGRRLHASLFQLLTEVAVLIFYIFAPRLFPVLVLLVLVVLLADAYSARDLGINPLVVLCFSRRLRHAGQI